MSIRLFILFVLFGFKALSQEYEYTEEDIYRSPIRKILNQFAINITSGYNTVGYSHDLAGFYYLQSPTVAYITENRGEALGNEEFVAYDNWLNNPGLGLPVSLEDTFDIPYPPLQDPVFNPLLNNDVTVYNSDSLGLGFEGRGYSIPLNLGVRMDIGRFRVGGGFSVALHKLKSLSPTVEGQGIRDYRPDFKTAFFNRYYGQIGYRFYDFWDYSFAAEIEVGKVNMGGNFATSTVMFYNFGLSIEKNLSEYFRVIFKPSYDLKSYNIGLPGSGLSIEHKNSAFHFALGVSINIPEIPRSPIKSDHVQLKHVITHPRTGRKVEVRGQPIWKEQNPKVGQNYRRLWRYKLRNRRKINPY